RPDHLFDRAEQDRDVQDARGDRVIEPVVVHDADPVARVEDEVDVVSALADLAEPVREGELGVASEALAEMVERLLDVGGAEKQIEVLHEPTDAQIPLERVTAADEEFDPRRGERAQDAAIETGRGWTRGPRLTPGTWRAILRKHGLAHSV